MTLQLAMDMAGTFPILGYLLIKKVFKNQVSAHRYIQMLRLSVILYLCPFQELKYFILPDTLLERFNLNDFWGIAGKKLGGFEVVNIPSLSGNYYVVPKRFFWVGILWLSICIALILYHYGTYFLIKRTIRKTGMQTEQVRATGGRSIEVFQSNKVKTPCTVGWIHPGIFIPEKDYTLQEKEWLLRHELTHIRHGDICWKCIAMVCVVCHWYNPFVYYLFHQYSVMCEYYCDAECMRGSDTEERKDYAVFLVKSAAVNNVWTPLTIMQGLTNNGEKMRERVDRIIDEECRLKKRMHLLITGIFTVLCMCSFMTVFVYSAVPEQDVPAEDNTFTEEEWEYFYGKDASDGDADLDFSASSLLFQDESGKNIPVDRTDLMQASSDKKQTDAHKKEKQKNCSHEMEEGTLKIHARGTKGSCHITAYEAQRCDKCGMVRQNTLLYTSDYASCSHNTK